ncbi:unnamed protein product, partial [Rotaria sp. Silwood2]
MATGGNVDASAEYDQFTNPMKEQQENPLQNDESLRQS